MFFPAQSVSSGVLLTHTTHTNQPLMTSSFVLFNTLLGNFVLVVWKMNHWQLGSTPSESDSECKHDLHDMVCSLMHLKNIAFVGITIQHVQYISGLLYATVIASESKVFLEHQKLLNGVMNKTWNPDAEFKGFTKRSGKVQSKRIIQKTGRN